jgi:hypothetical protein
LLGASGTTLNESLNVGYRSSESTFINSQYSNDLNYTALSSDEEIELNIFSMYLDSDSSNSITDGRKLYFNGIESDSTTNITQLTSNTSSAIGRNIGSLTNYADVSVAEILIYTDAMTDIDRAKIEAYLKNKWGTP